MTTGADSPDRPTLSPSTRERFERLASGEAARKTALGRYSILDTPPEDVFDRVGRLAARLFSTPIALVSFVEGQRQWFKSCFGVDVREADLRISFCVDPIASKHVVVIPDTHADPEFADHPLASSPYGIRFYAGAPLLDPEGVAIGTVCVMDTEPHPHVDVEDHDALGQLADIVIDELELRAATAKIHQSEQQYGALLEHALDGVFALSDEAKIAFANAAFLRLTGYEHDEVIHASLEQFVHPDDLPAARGMIHVARSGSQNQGQLRVLSTSGEYFHVDVLLASPRESDSGLMFGSARNVTPLKTAELESLQLAEELEQRVATLRSMTQVNQAINASLDLSLTLDILLEVAMTQLRADAAAVMLFDSAEQALMPRAVAGMRADDVIERSIPLGEGIAGRVAASRQPLHVRNLGTSDVPCVLDEAFRREGFVSYHALPLTAKDDLVGVLGIYHRASFEPDPEWRSSAEGLAMQAAIAIENASLVEDLQRSNTDLSLAYDATIEGWARTLDLKDEETEGHSRRVTNLSVKLARKLGIHGQELSHIRRGALLHDIGKMAIPDAILKKPGKLTESEWEEMKRHTDYGYDALHAIGFLRPALDIPRYHHERFDGTGYPVGLEGYRIPLSARIFAVVDVWDALTSDRPYRKAWTKERTIAHMRQSSGSHFDPDVLAAFLEMMEA